MKRCNWEIIEFFGVMKGGQIGWGGQNFHFTSLHNPIQPMIISLQARQNLILFLCKTMPRGGTKEAIALWKRYHHQFK